MVYLHMLFKVFDGSRVLLQRSGHFSFFSRMTSDPLIFASHIDSNCFIAVQLRRYQPIEQLRDAPILEYCGQGKSG